MRACLTEAAELLRPTGVRVFNCSPTSALECFPAATYEWALQEAGFKDFTWHRTAVAPEDVAHYGEAYWRDFHDNCLVIGLVCQK